MDVDGEILFICGMVNSVAQPVLVQVREERQRQCYIFRKMVRFAVFCLFLV